MKKIIWLLVVIMLIVHQDYWNWDNSQIVFGFMPIGLFYHVCLSLAAGFIWLLACLFAWPEGVDDFDNVPSSEGGEG